MHRCFMTESQRIKERVDYHTKGTTFTANDFTDLASKVNVSQVLSRLCRSGCIKRVKRGVYVKDKMD